MSNSIKIYQIYFKPEQREHLDPNCVPVDNTENPRPELREYDVWLRHFDEAQQASDLYGYVSWKVVEKLGLGATQMREHVESNPGHDVYLFNPCIANEALFANPWAQGDIHHPNISEIANRFLAKLGYKDYNVRDFLLDRSRVVFANYFIATRKFWADYMGWIGKMFEFSEQDPVFKDDVFGFGKSNYAHDKTLPNFIFLVERLLPTFIDITNASSCPYQYTTDTVPQKYGPVIGDITALSELKVLANKYDSDELYSIWNFYRKQLLDRHKNILNLE
jgi:hypothetical protein